MSDPSLHQLERDVEAARVKLAGDLATLRSPATYSEFTSDLKEEAFEMKDALVDKAKSSVQATIESVVDELKARAAANPTAALAIGAGIAWRLIQRPPIATALVGAGLYSLFRTTPTQTTLRTNEGYLSQAKDRLAEQATEFAESVKDRAVAVGETAAEKTSELAGSVKDRVLAMGEAATEKATELAGAATEQAQHWSAHARSSTQQIAGDAAAKIGKASNNLEEIRRFAADNIDEWSRPVQETLRSQESRDNLLLGTAGVAVVAALGIACKRRLSEPAEVE